MKALRSFALVMVLCACVVTLVACGKKDDKDKGTAPADGIYEATVAGMKSTLTIDGSKFTYVNGYLEAAGTWALNNDGNIVFTKDAGASATMAGTWKHKDGVIDCSGVKYNKK